MTATTTVYGPKNKNWIRLLEGRRIADATETRLTLDDGTTLDFSQEEDDCCSWVVLKHLASTDAIITRAEEVIENSDAVYEAGAFGKRVSTRVFIHVVTAAGELNVAEAEFCPGNGFYLHGFALEVTVCQVS